MRPVLALVSLVALSACGARAERAEPSRVLNPAVAAAIDAPLLTDPDLVSLDRRLAVLSDPGPLDGSLPPDDYAPATVAAARAEAAALVGGTAPGPLATGAPGPACARQSLPERAGVLGADCRGEPDFAWALGLPGDVPVYPKAHLQEAIGGQSCALRATTFSAPVPPAEVLAFYRSVAPRAGFALAARGRAALVGRRARDGARLAVIVRPADVGSSFDLIAG
jgi:hypothetical protein